MPRKKTIIINPLGQALTDLGIKAKNVGVLTPAQMSTLRRSPIKTNLDKPMAALGFTLVMIDGYTFKFVRNEPA